MARNNAFKTFTAAQRTQNATAFSVISSFAHITAVCIGAFVHSLGDWLELMGCGQQRESQLLSLI
jgi:hypothetical protein